MALLNANETQSNFRFYLTHVVGEGPFLRISGQLNKQSACMVESLIDSARENFDKGIGAVPPAAILEGIICVAKYKDGTYYRAKIINTANLSNGLVGVHFIDYGNKDTISLSTIRFLDNYDRMLVQICGQATDYYLARIMHPASRWEESLLLKLQSLLCYSEYPATVEAQTRSLPIVAVHFQGNDLTQHLVMNKYGISIPIQKQEVLLLQLTNESVQPMPTNWQQSFPHDASNYPEHVPFFTNQTFPSNPASAMRIQQPPFSGTYVPAPSAISQRLLVNKVTRAPVSVKAPLRQLQQLPPSISPALASSPPVQAPSLAASKLGSPKKATKTYKSRLLEVNTQHKVFVSYAEEGPELFAVQLATDGTKLQDMMDEINKLPHKSLTEPPMIGTVCLGRMSQDRIICRAIVMNLSGTQCKLFFVDFGDTEMVSYYDIFDIPEEFVKPNVFAMRFCLSGVKNLEKGPYLNEVFKQLVNGNILTLRVVAPEGPPLIQYGELYIDNKNVLDLLMATMKETVQFKWLDMLPRGSRHSVLVSYVDSCVKFFIQLSEKIDELNAVMDSVRAHCEVTSSPGSLPVGAACCAKFSDDGNWYRALIRGIEGNKVTVAYVDYGNEQEVNVSDLRTITPDLIVLPAQAMKCALKGFEDRPIETKTSNQLEMLALEKTLMAHIVGVLSGDTMLVSLVDDTVSPPLDVARKMMQLSQPRSNQETKMTTPVRKDAPESFSSPEGSIPDDSKKKGFRREKSFKEDRKPHWENNEEFGQRGSSFRGRENRDNFERSGPGRHSEKFAGRQDKGDRGDRRGSKPWENNPPAKSPISAADDVWEDTPSQPTFASQPPANRQNRDNDNKFNKQDEWEENSASNTNSRPERRPFRDFGDRRDNRGENGDRRDNRGENGDRRDNRGDYGDRRDNRGEKRDFHQKREFRDREDRGDRPKRDFRPREDRGDRPPRSNFTPRDRAERNFNADSDRRSERSFNSQDSNNRSPPYKSRGRFPQVQNKELSNPVSLETPFAEPNVDPNAQHEVSVTWIISPDSFYTQILSLQPKFLEMMHAIPEMYKGVKPYSGTIPVGASVLAKYPEDGVLYRAVILSVQPFGKFIVQYIDFGNKFLVDTRDIWQLDEKLMELPKMAVHCSLLGVGPKEGEWKASSEVDLCFNAPRYQCVFQECVDGKYKVSLWNNGVSVADMLVEKQLATLVEQSSSVALKDEAIDLTIIVGQQILCRVTHVEAFDKFYVQLDLEKADLVENAIANMDTGLLTPLSADDLADGVHCTVKHEEKIYRAILSDVTDTANIKAILPDYGRPITTSMENLMILPTEMSVYYYQSLECYLNNYTEESTKLMTIEQMKEQLTDRKLIVFINDVDGIKLVTTLYDKDTGKKIAIIEPDEGAYDEVVPLCTRAVFNYNFGMAYFTHCETLNEIYLQKSTDGDRLTLLLETMSKFYEEGTPQPLTTFDADALCAARSSDGNWYRATIISTTEEECKVQFPDYGNMETIAKESIKQLDPQFYEPCALALVTGLGLVALQDVAYEKLNEWTAEKEVQVTLSFGTDGWLASLHLDGVDLGMKLVNENLAAPQVDTEQVVEEVPAAEPISLPPGCKQVYISHIDSPGQFWLQMSDKIDAIEGIQADLQTNADSYGDLENRELGALCIAKYSADDFWYRAEILDADSDITTVRFIDYGNTDVLDNQPGVLKVMPDNLKETERYAVKSSVNAVPTGTGQWSEPASDYFTQLVGDISLPVDAMVVLKDVTTYVDIFVNGQNLTDKLVSEGHATRSEETECGGDLPSCFASHVNSPSEFWIQLETATTELQAMENAMVDAENFPELTEKEEGVLCAAKYPEDGLWYRAQVIVDGSEGTEVLFMDYGNASITTELRSLPDELKQKPALSRKCALQKPRDIKTWSRKSEVKFNELAAEGATIFNVQFIASGDISIVELYLEGKSVTEELVGLCEPHPLSERPTPLGQDLQSTGKVCYIHSLEEFYIHLDDAVAELDIVTNKLTGSAEFEAVPELKVGSICAALSDYDEQWYRAKILEFCDVGAHVQFIDYGNKAKCEEFRQLPENLVSIEPIAKCCRLVISDDTALNENAKARFDEIVAEYSTFQIEFLDTTKDPVLVRLTLNGVDIINLINAGKPESKDTESQLSQQEEVNHETVEPESKDETETKDSPREDEDADSSLTDLNESLESNHTVIENKSSESTDSAEDKSAALVSDAKSLEVENKEIVNENTVNENKSSENNVDLIDSKNEKNTAEELDKSVQLGSDTKSPEKTLEVEHKESSEVKTSENVDEGFKGDTKVEKSENENGDGDTKLPERDMSKESVSTDTGYISAVDNDNSPTIDSPVKEKTAVEESPADKELKADEKSLANKETLDQDVETKVVDDEVK